MNNNVFENFFEELSIKNEQNNPRQDGDYMKKDGLLYCGNCHTGKQCRVSFLGKERIVACQCKCSREKDEREERERKNREKLEEIAKMRASGIHDANIRGWTFANDDGKAPDVMRKARKYYDNWKQMYEDNIGLLLFGDVGTGKTYFAACIANALIDDGYPVLMTNFSKIINALSGFNTEDKNAYINSLNNYKLLIIDDLGVERQSDFAMEQVYNVIDSRYKNGQPIIVTTNISIEDIKNPADIKYKRIYDRIIEMTIPIKVSGTSRREGLHKAKLQIARELFAE